MVGLSCPKCGNEWIVDYGITMVQGKGSWYSYHEVYPLVPKYECSHCGNRWGGWFEDVWWC